MSVSHLELCTVTAAHNGTAGQEGNTQQSSLNTHTLRETQATGKFWGRQRDEKQREGEVVHLQGIKMNEKRLVVIGQSASHCFNNVLRL